MALSGTRTESAGLREFLNSPKGKTLSIAFAVVFVLAAAFFVWRALGPSDAEAIASDRVFIDAKTGHAFKHELKMGEVLPIEAPSGGKTGYPAELCYWTKDGQPKKDPTPVLMKSLLGQDGPTFCPDCGRLVVGHNPAPGPGVKVPPTEAEYKARGTRSNSRDQR